MKKNLKASLVFSVVVYALNNIYSALYVLGYVSSSVSSVLSPGNLHLINTAIGLLIGTWLLISYKRATSKFPLALIGLLVVCFFEPLIGTLAVALFYQLNQSQLRAGDDDIIDNLIQ